MGKIRSAELYLVKNANIKKGNTKIKNLESFLTAKTVRYNAQIEKDTLAMSEKPTLNTVRTIGKVAYSNPPKKLSRSLNLIFNKKNNPITPNMNKTPSKTKIVLVFTIPSLKIKEIRNEKKGGLNKSEYPIP